jgi:hypothetical protein
MKKITLKSATDELIGSASAGAGVVAASLAMKMANGKLNPWLIPAIALLAGYGIRLASNNEVLKDVGTGMLIAGTLDGAKKVLTRFSTLPGAETLNASIPSLSGVGDILQTGFIPGNLRGDYMNAEVVSSSPAALLR